LVPVTDDPVFTLDGAELARNLFDEICAVYDEAFSAPPFFWRDDESALHRERLSGLLSDPTFGIATAQVGAELVGFGYGFTVPVNTSRWSQVIPAPSVELAKEWPGRTFLLFDYAVRPALRGQGIGHRLHDLLLGSRSEERATLTVQPTAVDTKRLYERWRWRQVGQIEGGQTAAAPVFDVYLRDTLADLRSD
jgi:ribosomal protein S18 acetylase RimI-like enzyme